MKQIFARHLYYHCLYYIKCKRRIGKNMTNKVTYRQQYTRCGKDRCRKCKEGSGHGPYWYAYWSENGRTVSKYIGIRPPDDLVNSSDAGNIPVPSPVLPEISMQRQDTPIVRIYLLGQFRIEYQNQNGSQVADSRPSHRRRTRKPPRPPRWERRA